VWQFHCVQAVTQIQEMTLTFVPKIIAVFIAMVAAAPWIVETLVSYTRRLYETIPETLGSHSIREG
jgi:flagellar biosynthetic protein FliQ